MVKQLKERLTCSGFSSSSGESLFGTAPIWDWCICIEVPLPWEPDILFSEFFQKHFLTEKLNQLSKDFPRIRILGITFGKENKGNGIRVLSFRADGRDKGKTSYLFPEADFGQRLLSFIDHPDREEFKPFTEISGHIQDYLVCTHGNRDVCCGFWGYQLYKQLSDNYSAGDIRFWRASHIGGHKFAPTVVSLDDARFWGRVDAKDFIQIINREGEMETINAMYRGNASCRSLEEQLIEKKLFSIYGWDLDYKRLEIQAPPDNILPSKYKVNLFDPDKPSEMNYSFQLKIQEESDTLTYGCTTRPTFSSAKKYSVVDFREIA